MKKYDDNEIWNAVMKAAHSRDTLKIALLIHQHGTDKISKIHSLGSTVYTHAIWHSPKHMVEMLLDFGFDVNVPNNAGKYPIHLLMRRANTGVTQDEYMIRRFLAAGADIDSKNKEGYTPLILAARQGHVPLVKLMLSLGSDAHIKDYKGYTATDHALIRNHKDVADILREYTTVESKPMRVTVGKMRLFFRKVYLVATNLRYLIWGDR